jgi:putative phosphoribosyl transferase
MIFANRSEAGLSLSWRLTKYADRNDVVILGIPRGGVPVAFEVARALNLPLDIFLLRKLGIPGHEELAFGAIASGESEFLTQRFFERWESPITSSRPLPLRNKRNCDGARISIEATGSLYLLRA